MRYLFFLYFLILFTPLISQNNFKSISSDTTLVIEEKAKKMALLMQRYTNENKTDSLILETYDILKWHFKVNNLDKAIELNRRNIALMDSINYKDAKFYRRNIYSLGYYESRNNETENALKTFKTLLNYNEPDTYALNSTYEIAEIYYYKVIDYYKALEYYKLSNLLSKKLKNNTLLAISTLGIGKSNLLINTSNSIKEAIKITSNTIKHFESSPLSSVDDYYLLELYKLLGNLHSDRDDYNFKIAMYNFDKALNIASKAGFKDQISLINNDIGLIYFKDKQPEAENFFNKAAEYKGDNVIFGIVKRNLARYYLDTSNFDQALISIQQSIEALNLKRSDSLSELPKKERLKSNKFNNQLISSLIVKSDVWLKLSEVQPNKTYYYKQAIKTIELGEWLINISRLSDIEYKSKLFWRKTATSLYLKGVELCYKSNKPEDAFYYFEKNKALQLLEDINLKSLRANTKIPDKIYEREKVLKDKILKLESIKKKSSSEKTNRDVIVAKNNYDNFINSLDGNIRLLYKSGKQSEVISLKSFKQNYLQSNKVYLSYMLNNEDGYGLLISQNNIKLYKINDVEKLKTLSINYRNYLNAPIRNNQQLEKFSKTSHALYNLLLPREIKSLLEQKEITILPDSYLQNIPFDSLLTSANNNTSYLIHQNQVNYSYSITFLIKNKELKRKNNHGIVGFAPINFKDNLPQLINTKTELNAIEKITSADLFFYEDATKNNFLMEGKKANIIHIASHANANDTISPWISFYDQKLFLEDLSNYDSSAELVVLSACNTSLGEVYKGEGVMSLSRGFFNSGSQSVLTTLWEINDKASTQLIDSFYKNLKTGQNKSLALHNSKLNYLKNASLSESSPYYWASFILIGDTGTIELDSSFKMIHYFILGFILLIVIFLLLRYKKL